MNKQSTCVMQLVIALASAAMFSQALADKPISSPAPLIVGDASDYQLRPDLERATVESETLVWTHTVSHPGASFTKLHFKNFNLHGGDRVEIVNSKGRVIDTLIATGPKSSGNFWGLSSQGETSTLRFVYNKPYTQPPFEIDRIITGRGALHSSFYNEPARTICDLSDFDDAICYQNDSGKWANVQASVGVMSVGDNAENALFCSGANISPNNLILTNEHCVQSQAACDNTEFVFRYYRTACNVGAPATDDWVSFRCDQLLASEPLVSCDAGPGDLDFSLNSVIGDPAAEFGFIEIDTTPLTSGEEIYIIQHPSYRPHEITIGSGPDVVVDGTVLRYFNTLDTEAGSSGSPVIRASNNKLTGLHHCGGCTTEGVGNRGMLISDIYPLIEGHLCGGQLLLKYTGTTNLNEISGNHNQIVEPGETWSFSAIVQNEPCSIDTTNITGLAVPDTGSENTISIANGALSFGDAGAGASAISNAVVFEVFTEAQCASQAGVDLINLGATEGAGFSDLENALMVSIGGIPLETLYAENFAAGLKNWTIIDAGDGSGVASTWTASNPGNRQLSLNEPFMIADSDRLGSGFTMDESAISASVDISQFDTATLQFNHVFKYYEFGLPEQADVEVRSALTGGNWVTVQNFSGADASGLVSLDITAYKAIDLQVRFRYHNARYEWYWAVDDVIILGDNGFVCEVFAGPDTDLDGVIDTQDNCQLTINVSQFDADADGYGNACDPDLNNDGIVNFADVSIFASLFNTNSDLADFNEDGHVNFADFIILPAYFLLPPGPSGLISP